MSKSEEAIDQDFISVMYGEVLPYYLHMVCIAKKIFWRENVIVLAISFGVKIRIVLLGVL